MRVQTKNLVDVDNLSIEVDVLVGTDKEGKVHVFHSGKTIGYLMMVSEGDRPKYWAAYSTDSSGRRPIKVSLSQCRSKEAAIQYLIDHCLESLDV